MVCIGTLAKYDRHDTKCVASSNCVRAQPGIVLPAGQSNQLPPAGDKIDKPWYDCTSKGIDGGPSQCGGSHACGSCDEGGVQRQSPKDVLQQQGLACPRTPCEEGAAACPACTSINACYSMYMQPQHSARLIRHNMQLDQLTTNMHVASTTQLAYACHNMCVTCKYTCFLVQPGCMHDISHTSLAGPLKSCYTHQHKHWSTMSCSTVLLACSQVQLRCGQWCYQKRSYSCNSAKSLQLETAFPCICFEASFAATNSH